MSMSAFFTLHRDLPREGPGEPAEVAWAGAGLPPHARICDAACGPGADIAALLDLGGTVEAVEKQAHFVAQVEADWGHDPRVSVRQGDMGDLEGPYDLIWCAGALYFLGIEAGLRAWRNALAPGGVVAFSEACWFTDARSDRAVANWAAYPEMTNEAGIDARVRAAGYETLATRRVSDAAWEAYYTPMAKRIAQLRPGADAALNAVLEEGAAEIEAWRAHRDEFGYLLSVVRPS